ncbi:MAG: LysM peptidoglycan-binding domain-containing protein [Treponema sp.]|nr:LysM peptidoglycan-binding domain-containing protein [Treponema sp.]
MKKLIPLLIITAFIVLFGCATTGEKGEPLPPPGTERLTLGNAALAMYRFDLPPGQTWANYNKISAEYLVDEENFGRPLRSGAIRLYGNYEEDDFIEGYDFIWDDAEGDFIAEVSLYYVSLGTDANFAERIIYNVSETWESLGAKPNEWFLYEYDISGAKAHGQFNRVNIPNRNDRGPFYFAMGITAQEEVRILIITHLIRNVTLHHATNPALNVVSTGSGFDLPAFASYGPVTAKRVAGPPLPASAPVAATPTPAPTPTPAAAPTQGIVLEGARNYTVQSGDTLSSIAARIYGESNMFYFPLIRLANSSVVTDPDRIEPGTVLVIPNLPPNLNSDGAKAQMRADMLNTAARYDRQNMPQSAAELRRLAGRL